MKVDIFSRKMIEQLLEKDFPKNTAVVSFYSLSGKFGDKETPVDYNGRAEMLFSVAVDDIDVDELEEFGLTYATYFKEADALAKFIYRAYEKGLDIICQCEYGQGRSAACAAAILEHFEGNGISVFRDYKYYPNKLIFNKMCESLEKVRRAKQITEVV